MGCDEVGELGLWVISVQRRRKRTHSRHVSQDTRIVQGCCPDTQRMSAQRLLVNAFAVSHACFGQDGRVRDIHVLASPEAISFEHGIEEMIGSHLLSRIAILFKVLETSW